MARFVRGQESRLAVTAERRELKRVATTRLSGASSEVRRCNPVDLTVAPFDRVTAFDFEDMPLTRVRAVPAPVDDTDW